MKIKQRVSNQKKAKNYCLLGVHNALKCSRPPAEDPMHRNTKYMLCCYCWDHGLQFTTEAKMSGYGRADFLLHDFSMIIEVCHTERLLDALKKPYPLPILAIPSGLSQTEIYSLMNELEVFDGDESIIKIVQNNILRQWG